MTLVKGGKKSFLEVIVSFMTSEEKQFSRSEKFNFRSYCRFFNKREKKINFISYCEFLTMEEKLK